ncbi:hypothetical protein KR009_012112 [Drosophila setifemur]|nr:hypothetical protein KR009_012112 [Drosophila setifemur]
MGDFGSKVSWAAGKKLVLCVGTTIIDYVSIMETFPGNEVELAIKGYWQRGGSASNICTMLRHLGVKCEFFGMLSNLQMFQVLPDDMKARGIITEHCPTCSLEPPFSTIFLTRETRSRNVIKCNNDFPHVTLEDFRKLDLNKYGWINMRCIYFPNTLAMAKELTAYNATKQEKIILSMKFDMNLKEMWPLVDYCDYAIFSKQLAPENGWQSPMHACLQLDEQLRMRWGLNLKRPIVIVLWGDQGAGVLDLAGNYTSVPAHKPHREVDTFGAGDTFFAAFIYAMYVRERSLLVSVDFGNQMASYKCTRSGYDHIAKILLPPVL